jgi:hypothetical protein
MVVARRGVTEAKARQIYPEYDARDQCVKHPTGLSQIRGRSLPQKKRQILEKCCEDLTV